jgi:hypothetical protein
MSNSQEKEVISFVLKGGVTKDELRQVVVEYNASVAEDKRLDPDGVFDTPLRIGSNLPMFVHRCFNEYTVRSTHRTHKALYKCFVTNPDEMTWVVRKNGEFITTEQERRVLWNSYDYESDQARDYHRTKSRYLTLRREFLERNNTATVLKKLNNFVLVRRLWDDLPVGLFELIRAKYNAIQWD